MPRALQDRGICGLIAVQPALVVQHEWPEDETEFPVVRASRVRGLPALLVWAASAACALRETAARLDPLGIELTPGRRPRRTSVEAIPWPL